MNLHFTDFFKISVAWVKVKSAFHTSLWLAQSFCILCMSLISSLKNHISSDWHIWALSLSHASTDSSFHWWRIKEAGPTPVPLCTKEAPCLDICLCPVPCFVILPFIWKLCVPALLGACCKEGLHCLLLKAAEEQPPSPPKFHIAASNAVAAEIHLVVCGGGKVSPLFFPLCSTWDMGPD